jgi:lysozyme family protein
VQLAPPSTASTHFKSTHTWLAFLTIWHSNNGFGYRAHGINSPYLWSYSNQYHPASLSAMASTAPTAVSGQAGGMPIFKSLCTLDKTISFDGKPAAPAAPAAEPHELTVGDL